MKTEEELEKSIRKLEQELEELRKEQTKRHEKQCTILSVAAEEKDNWPMRWRIRDAKSRHGHQGLMARHRERNH